MKKKNLGLIPLRNFAVIDHKRNILRSEQPSADFVYGWLRDHCGIKTLINIRSEKNIDGKHAPKYGINVITFRVKDHHPPTMKQVRRFMELIKNQKDVLIHCEHGHGRTSTFSILTKIALGATLTESLRDERKRFKFKFTHPSQNQFFNQFKNK